MQPLVATGWLATLVRFCAAKGAEIPILVRYLRCAPAALCCPTCLPSSSLRSSPPVVVGSPWLLLGVAVAFMAGLVVVTPPSSKSRGRSRAGEACRKPCCPQAPCACCLPWCSRVLSSSCVPTPPVRPGACLSGCKLPVAGNVHPHACV